MKIVLEKLRSNFLYATAQTWNRKPGIWLAAIAVSGFLAFYWDSTPSKSNEAHASEDPASASTLIPAGYVLVPIEVANFESLDSILGNFGVVDLYQPSDDPKKRARKVAQRLKILRAPLNPSHFAVLAREADSARLVSHQGPFTVIVQNPNRASGDSGTSLVKDDMKDDDLTDDSGFRKPSKSGFGHSRISVEVTDEKEL